jgi:hypothetical protein
VNLYAGPQGSSATFVASNWRPLATETFAASGDAPTNEPVDGQLWYNPNFGEADIMYHNGTTWVGYRDASAFPNTDSAGPQVSASAPTTQSDGVSSLVNGDIWISTADLENFPMIYRWDGNNLEWVLLDKSDQTTEDGVLFADARWGIGDYCRNADQQFLRS